MGEVCPDDEQCVHILLSQQRLRPTIPVCALVGAQPRRLGLVKGAQLGETSARAGSHLANSGRVRQKAPQMSLSLSRLWVRLRPYFTTLTLVYGLLAAVFGSVPLLSLLKRVLSIWNWKIDLLRFPEALLLEYERLRAATFGKIIEVLRGLEIPIPDWFAHFFSTWIADLSVIYLLFAVSVLRGSTINRRLDRIKLKADPEGFHQQLRSAAQLHGHRTPDNLISAVESGLAPGFWAWVKFQSRIFSSAIRWPVVIKRNLVQLRRGVATDLALGLMAIWIMMLACAILGATVYVLLSLMAN
jgi:hypothetical protein